MWIASDSGLIKYNGKQFIVTARGNYQKFVGLNHTETAVLGKSNVLLLTAGAKPDSSRFQFLNDERLSGKQLLSLISSNEGKKLWLLFEHGLYTFENEKLASIPLEDFGGRYSDCLMSVFQNKFQVITRSGTIYQWDEKTNGFLKFSNPSGFTRLVEIVSYDDSLRFVLDDFSVKRLSGNKISPSLFWKGLPDNIQITSIGVFDEALLLGSIDQGIWIGTRSGKGFLFKKMINGSEPHRIVDLPFADVKKLFISHHKNIWVLSTKELWFLKSYPFSRISFDIPNASFEQAAFLDNGKIYLDSENGLFECYKTAQNQFAGGIANVGLKNLHSAIASDGKRLWIASIDNIISYYENDKLFKVADLRSRGAIIFNIATDKQRNVWVMQAPDVRPITGIYRITPDLKTREYTEADGFQSRMLSVRESPYGVLYCAGIGETSYLYKFDRQADKFINISAEMKFDYGENFEVHDLAITADSIIWLASTAGLLKYKNERIEKIPFDELYDNEIVAVDVADDGSVWASTDSRGIVHLKNNNYTFFDQRAGLASNFLTYRSIVNRNGTVFVGTREGFFFSESGFRPFHKTFTPTILSVRNGVGENQTTNVFPFNTTLTLDFVSLTHPVESIEYAYRINPNNSDRWTNLFRNNSLVLTNLESGSYILEIRARQSGGYEWSEPLTYAFIISKKWYWQNAAIFFYGVIFIASSIAAVGIYNRRLRREKQILERKVSERTREIAAKNDEISTQMEELKQLNDEIATQRDNLVKQKEVIEDQNSMLAIAKIDLEQKVKERTNELSASNRELIDHNIQLEQFTFMTAHNLRAPVARLMGLTTIFNNTDPADPINNEVVKRIQESAIALDEIIRDISTILQIKKSVGETFQNIPVKPVLLKVISSFQSEIAVKKIVIYNLVDPKIVIHGIEPYLYSIFYNIISNSIKYADLRKAPEITIEAIESNGIVNLIFTDNGIGFDAENQKEKLFKPFSRLNSIADGKGLGLYLIKIEMESMRGSVAIQSKVGVGTKVTLIFGKT